LEYGSTTGLHLSHIVSSWTWCMLLSRPALSIFSVVYSFIQRASKREFEIWPSVRKELINAILLAPLYFSSFTSQFSSKLIATDASLSGAGVVCTRFNNDADDLFHSMWNIAISKHGLLANDILSSESVISNMPHQPSLSLIPDFNACSQFLPSVSGIRNWSTILSYPFKFSPYRDGDIAALEFEAVLSAIKWYLSSPSSISSRLLMLNDNSNVYYALHKGRISSYSLLRIQRKINSLLLASGLTINCCWIPSAFNPADSASRAFQHTQYKPPWARV
jgi:hypothetical protein